MKPIIIVTVSLLLASLFSTGALAGNQLSLTLKIIALQMEDDTDALQLIVRRNIEYQEPAFAFNPANCISTVIPVNSNGKNGGDAQYFSIPFGTVDHSAGELRQMLNQSFTALITSRSVRLNVRDDICTNEGGRVVSGLQLQG